MKKAVSLIGIAVLMLFTGPLLAGDYTKQKVVYHLNSDDPKMWNAALGNIQNHINAVGKDNIEVKLVMHGGGVDMLKQANNDMTLQSRVINLKSQNVAMEVCNNTLVNKKIDYKNDLFDVDKKDIVPSGVAELAKLQQQGYVYVKP